MIINNQGIILHNIVSTQMYWVNLNKWNMITLDNKDTDEKRFEDMHKIFLYGICDTMNISVEADKFGVI